ncbi:MAG: DUF92 domain-containing protein [Candidatus Eremiobacteraeota bacterium]|nr:DUF92 domain-containing protein [Candidatus Eremiobacteraeota bacterium]
MTRSKARSRRQAPRIDRLSLAPLTNFDIGAFFAILIALAAWRAKVLTGTGALAAVIIGTLVYGSGGWPNAAVLFAFFISSVILSRIGRARKKNLVDAGKLGARDGEQVLANGLVAAVCAMFALGGNPLWQIGFVAAFATATSDTWATETGTLVRVAPRSILTGKPMPVGLSGGVTSAGTAAALLGALFVALIALSVHASGAVLAVTIGGFTGCLVDSVLGATVQALRYCAGCKRYCETDPHVCGADTTLMRGANWMNNDAVNFLATVFGAATAIGVVYFFPYFFSR